MAVSQTGVFDREPSERVDRTLEIAVARLVSEREQRIDRVHHRRVNRRQAVAALEVIEHPPARRANRAPAERFPRPALVRLHDAIEQQERIVPADGRRVPLERPGTRGRIAKELVHARLRHDQLPRPQRIQDRQRHDDRARPRRHAIDVEAGPGGEHHELGGHRRHQVPSNRPDEREIEARERVGPFQSAHLVDAAPGPDEVRRVGCVAGELQPEIRLDGRVELGRPAFIDAPAAVGKLAPADVIGQLRHRRRAMEDVEIQNVVGFERRVRLEFAAPVPLVGLALKQPRDAARDRAGQTVVVGATGAGRRGRYRVMVGPATAGH